MTDTKPTLPLVSVIIPTRNRAALLDRALASVFAQEGIGQHFELDVIVVDDGSADSTADVARRYPVAQLIASQHRGAAGARNAGIQASRGRFVCFLDDDDVWLPTRLKLQVPALECHPEAGAVYSQVFHTETGRAYPELSAAASGRIFEALLSGNFMCVHSVLIRREALEKAGFFDESLSSYEDWDLWLRLSFHFPFVFVPGLVGVYVVSAFGLWQQGANAAENNARVVEKALQLIPDGGAYTEMKTTARLRVALAYCPTWAKVLDTVRGHPGVMRHQWAQRWVSCWIWTRAAKTESPLSEVRRLCAELKAAMGHRRLTNRRWVRQTIARAWSDTASALAKGAPAQRRDAAHAAVRALVLSPSLFMRSHLVRIIATGLFGSGAGRLRDSLAQQTGALTSTPAAPESTRSAHLYLEPNARSWQRWEVPLLVSAIALSVGVRLIRVTQPFVDSWSWKQLTNAMIARNFYLQGYHFLFPQIDWAGPFPGYIGTELPLVPFTAALLYRAFGIHEWIGRSLSIAFFAASVPFFYLLVRKVSSARSAAVALGAYCAAPLTLCASRSFQSDMASVSFCLMALYLTCQWLDNPSSRTRFLLAVGATGLAIATKLPQLIVGVPMLYLCWDKYGFGLFRRRDVWVFGGLALLLPLAWEAQAYHISVSYYPYHFAGEGGIRMMDLQGYREVLWRTLTFSLTPILSAALLGGVVVRPQTRYGRLFHWWLLAFVVFLIFAARENRHPWVQMPLVPIAAAFLGFLFDRTVRSISRFPALRSAPLAIGLLVLLPLFYVSYRAVQHPYRPWQEPDYKAAHELKRISQPDALILAVEEGEPAMIYYSERKGWHFLSHFGALPRDSAEAISELEKYIGYGASYIVFDCYEFYWLDHYQDFARHLDSHYTRVSQTADYLIFRLRSTPDVVKTHSEESQPLSRALAAPGHDQTSKR